jgi:uncharacterized protein YecE (DUF72 family)
VDGSGRRSGSCPRASIATTAAARRVGGGRGDYSDAELREWAARLRAWRREVEVFAYFNNGREAFAPANARRLRELVGDS